MEGIDSAKLAAQIATRLNRPADEENPALFFKVSEESFKVVICEPVEGGETKVSFQFEGMVMNLNEPVTYLASGSVMVQSSGEIRPETLEF
ncbi:MAG: hypothetical protein JRG97_11420 [Deltaproteobacteria bacterium]|nr:hypothetical protein [Deltaproteobacteria bacterium]MBW2053161.1 hypothetical protein [Deltaproteobacteria bacterium]MBW2141662.1 hypothetical protein [Deltaproteobacteria bacterium]MBW2323591.1 hypothetical protein [Deltaproteobacteria bacterium]